MTMSGAEKRLTLALIARIPAEGVAGFQAYEERVLPLLGSHGGTLERRLRTVDGRVELHIVSFPSEAALASFRADPERTRTAPLLEASGARTELLMLEDVT